MTLVWMALAGVCVLALLGGGAALRVVRERDAAVRRVENRVQVLEAANATLAQKLEAQRILLAEARAWLEAQKRRIGQQPAAP